MTVVDVHAHVIVRDLLGDGTTRPRVFRDQAGQAVQLRGATIRSAVDEFVDPEAILSTQRARGIDHVLLCPWVAVLEHWRELNDGLARLRAEHPDTISVLGAVPLAHPAVAARELERLMATGAFAGVQVTASVAGDYLGDARFAPFWAAAEATRALVFVHPTTRGFADPVFERHYLWNLIGNPMETTIAAADLIMGGTLERHPDLRILLAHAGGAIVALRGRLRHGHRAVAAARGGLSVAPDELVGRFLFDTVTHDPAALRDLVDVVGADRVLLGTDYPFDMGDAEAVATVRAAGLSRQEERGVLGGNAARVLTGVEAVRA